MTEKEKIIQYIDRKISDRLERRKFPLIVLLNDVTSEFGREILPVIRELIAEKKLFWGETINHYWVSTIKDVWNHELVKLEN